MFRGINFTIILWVLHAIPSFGQINKLEALKRITADNDIGGVQLAYSANGKSTLYSNGFASDTHGRPVTANTVFRAGSLGKSVFAYAVMRLYDKGLITLDTPLLHYIGSYSRFDSADARYSNITARMVLSHTSGLEFFGDEKIKLIADPGTVFSYSSGGYYFLQQLVEKITGMPLEALMHKEVFAPLKMVNSTYTKNLTQDTEVLGQDDFEPNAAFSLYTTAADYNKFLKALLNHTGLSTAAADQMFARQSDAQWLGRDTTNADNYIDWGLGVGLQRNEKGRAIWHWGSIMQTFNSFYIMFPDTKESLVYFTNSVSGLRAANEIVDLFIGRQTTWATKWLNLGYDEPETMMALHKAIATRRFAKIAGIVSMLKANGYHFSARDMAFYGNTLLKQKKLTQSLSIYKQNVSLYPRNAGAYADVADVLLKMGNKPAALSNYKRAFSLDTGAKAVAYHIKALHNNTHLGPQQLQAFEGKYKLNIMEGILMDVKAHGAGLSIDVPGGIKNSLFYAVSPSEFLNDENGFTLKFLFDKSGAVIGILIHTKDTADVWDRVRE